MAVTVVLAPAPRLFQGAQHGGAGRGQLACRTRTRLFGEASEDVLFRGHM